MPSRHIVAALGLCLLPALACPPNAAAQGPVGGISQFGPGRGVIEYAQPAPIVGPARLLPRVAWAAHGYSGSNLAEGVPTFNYGYFGAHGQGVAIWHRGYYRDYTQWSYRWGY